MAVTGNKNYDELMGQGIGTGASTTKQNDQQQAAQKPAAYTPSQNVLAAQQAMQQTQAQKPQGYTSKYGPALDAIIQQIQNPQEFKYEFNADNVFKNYALLYGENARQASMDAMGQAAALTGGYGNSYAQQVGNQAYNEEMRKLYEVGMQLQQQAYQRHQDQRADQYNQYGVLSGEEGKDYERYNDDYNRWLQERDYATGRYDTERNIDYGMYRDQMADYQAQLEFDEKVREFDASLNWEKMSSNQKYAAEYAMSILQNGQMPSEALLLAAGLSAEDAQKMMAKLSAGGGGGGGKKGIVYIDGAGQYYTYDKNGKAKPITKEEATRKNYILDTTEMNKYNGTVAVSRDAVGNTIAELFKKNK